MKIAYNAGHILATAGKRLPKELDKNETREWTLNDRIARYFAEEMNKYDNVELRRMDDPKGIEPIDIDVRVAEANKWGADFYLSIHHNAAGVIFNGGGAEVYIDADGGTSEKYAKAIYNAIIDATGLVGNRSDPLRSASDGVRLYEVRATKMPAVLVEYGYMDSRVDAPIILSDSFAKKAAVATAEAIAKQAGLKKKVIQTPATQPSKNEYGAFCVQVGSFSKKANAEKKLAAVKSAGFDNARLTHEAKLKVYRVIVGYYFTKASAVQAQKKLATAGFSGFVAPFSGSGTPVFGSTSKSKNLEAAAKDVLKGKYGNGETRKKKLADAGYTSDEIKKIQEIVNELLA